MSDTLTGPATEPAAHIPEYPMARSTSCPFAPPPDVLALGESKPLCRVRIWDGSTPWLVSGYEEVRTLFSDPRGQDQCRRPAPRISTLERRHAGDRA